MSSPRSRREGTPGQLNRPLVRALGERGLLSRVLGGEVPALELCLIREGLARYCTEAETAFAVQGLGAHPILANGSPDVVADWLPRVAAGEAIAGFALTEPGAGSDVAALALQADRDGDGFRLTGEKIYISNAPDADIYSVFARTSERGLTAFAVPRASEGLSGEPLSLLSPHPIGRLIFDGVPVPADHVLGEVDQGFKVAMRTLDLFRPSVGAFAVGMAQAALDAAVAHVTTREAFGRTLSQLQGVSHQLADVATACRPRACSSTAPPPPTTTACGRPPRPPRWRSCSPPRPRSGRSTSRSRSTAHAPSKRATSSSTSTGRSARRASTRVPRRSSARSSPASSSAAPSKSPRAGRDSAGRALVSL